MPSFPPMATNKINSLGSFVQRKFYNENAYPSILPKPIDLWYEKALYGRVDNLGNAISPSESFLKQFRTSQGSHFALNFVVDAFEDLKNTYTNFERLGKLEIDISQLVDIDSKSAWENPNELLDLHMKTLYEVFNETYMADVRNDIEVLNIKSFIKIFVRFFDSFVSNSPFTRTGFLQSGFCTPAITGLVIRIAEEMHSEDRVKFENFIQDPNFVIFARMAQRFGFSINKNAPWELIADINSPALKPYMDVYNLTSNNIFETVYYKAYDLDIETLKIYLLQFYNTYVVSKPSVQIFRKCRKNKDKTITEIKLRQPITKAQLDQMFSNVFWLKVYAYMRARETGKFLTQRQFDNIVKNIKQINKFVSFEEALKFINKGFLGTPINLTLNDKNEINILSRNPEFLNEKTFSLF